MAKGRVSLKKISNILIIKIEYLQNPGTNILKLKYEDKEYSSENYYSTERPRKYYFEFFVPFKEIQLMTGGIEVTKNGIHFDNLGSLDETDMTIVQGWDDPHEDENTSMNHEEFFKNVATELPKITSGIYEIGKKPILNTDQAQDFHSVKLVDPSKGETTNDQALWAAIRLAKIDFEKFNDYVQLMFENKFDINSPQQNAREQLRLNISPFQNVASYQFLKQATDYFLLGKTLFFDDLNEPKIFSGFNALSDEDVKKLSQLYKDGFFLDSLSRAIKANFPLNILGEDLGINDEDDRKKFKSTFYPINSELVDYGYSPSQFSWHANAQPMFELIWSYWMEEAGLVQTMNAISLRFQNVRRRTGPDPLANLALDSLRPLSNLLWGYIEDERDRTSIIRRCYEYDSQYGISLRGRAIPILSSVESRSKFLGSFHQLLKMAFDYFQQSNILTVKPDAFPILNQLREVHVILREGQHNQFRDLTWTSRVEMMTQQWILSREEVKEFIRGRYLVPYEEKWMGTVDTMKRLQNWTDTSVTHFFNLASNGEQLLLSIRYGDWANPTYTAENAANWVQFWRNEIQRYLHAYRAVTSVDLSADLVETRPSPTVEADRYLPPAHHLERREMGQNRRDDYRSQMPQPVFSQNGRR